MQRYKELVYVVTFFKIKMFLCHINVATMNVCCSDNMVYIVTLDEDTGQLNKKVYKARAAGQLSGHSASVILFLLFITA